jgi:hypothetical protein
MIIDQRSRITDTVSFIAASGAVLGWDEVALSAQLLQSVKQSALP